MNRRGGPGREERSGQDAASGDQVACRHDLVKRWGLSRPVGDPGFARHGLAWGVGAAGLYLVITLWTGGGLAGVRILYDGIAPPPPYRWVRPPAPLAARNGLPEAGAGSVALTAAGSEYSSIATGDGQAVIIFPPRAIAARRGEPAAAITLKPLDPAALDPAPPGMRLDGNAYRIDARYTPSQSAVLLQRPVTVVLRFPTTGRQVLRSTGQGWTALRTTPVPGALQDIAETDRLGTFAVAAPLSAQPGVALLLFRFSAALLWVVAALLLAWFIRQRRRRHPP